MAEHILSLSYGKDSIACIEAIKQLGLPLDRIFHAEVWATDTIPADLPPMVEFKAHADKIIKARYGIDVEHVCVLDAQGCKWTYERIFYKKVTDATMVKRKAKKNWRNRGVINAYGFPTRKGPWCQSKLKTRCLDFLKAPHEGRKKISCNILASLRTNPSALSAIQKWELFYHWYKSAGTKPTAGNGARKMICCRRYTPPLRGAGAGFATIRALTSCAYCAKTTPTCGRCC